MRKSFVVVIDSLRPPDRPAGENIIAVFQAFADSVLQLKPVFISGMMSYVSSSHKQANEAFTNLIAGITRLKSVLNRLLYNTTDQLFLENFKELFAMVVKLKSVEFKKDFNALLGFDKRLDLEARFKTLLQNFEDKLLQSFSFDEFIASPEDLASLKIWIVENESLPEFSRLKASLNEYLVREESTAAQLPTLWAELDAVDREFLRNYCINLAESQVQPMKLALRTAEQNLVTAESAIESILLADTEYNKTKSSLESLPSEEVLRARIYAGRTVLKYEGDGIFFNEDAERARMDSASRFNLKSKLAKLKEDIMSRPIHEARKNELSALQASISAAKVRSESLEAELKEAENLYEAISKKQNQGLAKLSLKAIRNLHNRINELRAKRGEAIIVLPSLAAWAEDDAHLRPATGLAVADLDIRSKQALKGAAGDVVSLPSAPPAPVAAGGAGASSFSAPVAAIAADIGDYILTATAPPAPALQPVAAEEFCDPLAVAIAGDGGYTLTAVAAPTSAAAGAAGAPSGRSSSPSFFPAVANASAGFDASLLPVPPTTAVPSPAVVENQEEGEDPTAPARVLVGSV